MRTRNFLVVALNDNRLIPAGLATKSITKLTLEEIQKHIADPNEISMPDLVEMILQRRCRRCGCTDDDCRQCIARTGEPCSWVEDELCSACVTRKRLKVEGPVNNHNQ